MKASAASAILAMLAGSGLASKEFVASNAESLAASDSPLAVSMDDMMERKLFQRKKDHAAGFFDKDRYRLQPATSCSGGKAGEYSCKNVDLKGFLRHQDLGSKTRAGNDVWGWTSSTGREFGIVGQTDGVGFVEVLKNGSLKAMGRLPTQTYSSIWRDMKVIGNHVYIGADHAGDHGLQIFDLTKLLKVDPNKPPTFNTTSDLTARFSGFGSSHNIVAHEKNNIIYVVGTDRRGKCRGGLWMVDVSDPKKPRDAGCAAQDGYVHDAQCVTYKGPSKAHQGKEICFCYNESALTIVDLSQRSSPKQLSRTTYNGASYTHQGWLTGKDQRYLLLDDELDEERRAGAAADGRTTTYIVDVSNLTKPVFTGYYKSPAKAIDHNQYVVDGLSYMSNYGSGLRIVNVTSVVKDSKGSGFKEVGFFDVYPEDDSIGGNVTFNGAWSVYPYFQSGYLLVNSIERGIYSLKLVSKNDTTATLSHKPIISPYTLVGCWGEGKGVRALGHNSTTSDKMTNEACATYCKSYKYFGTEYGRECYCGSFLADSSKEAPPAECNMPCSGDQYGYCGGRDRLELYRNPNIRDSQQPDAVGNYTLVGCQTEGKATRALVGSSLAQDDMTNEVCAKWCKDYEYFGTEYGRECYCGSTLDASSTVAPATECRMLCAGSNTEFCGAGNRLSVYKKK